MATIKRRLCDACHVGFQPRGSAQKYCPPCRTFKAAAWQRISDARKGPSRIKPAAGAAKDKRACLRCAVTFKSSHPGNRRCPACYKMLRGDVGSLGLSVQYLA